MLEVLLAQYLDQFGEPFPLQEFTDYSEIEAINILYACIQLNSPYDRSIDYGKENRFPDAPGKQ